MRNLAVWKYSLGMIPQGTVEIQRGAKILSVGEQEGIMTIWALVDTDEIKVHRNILVVGTGHVYEDETFDKEFIGTIFFGAYVFHIFDGGEV